MKTNNQAKLCYCILVHQDSELLHKLVIKLLEDQRSVVNIHVDQKQSFKAQALVERFSQHSNRINIISKVKIFWGHYSMCIAMRYLMKSSIVKWPTLIRITFLSGQHYLLLSAKRINDFFIYHQREQFVETFDMYTQRWIMTGVYKRRYCYYWPFPPKLYVNTIVRALNRVLNTSRNIPRNMHPYSGSQWISITHEVAQYIIQMMEQTDINKFYSKTFIPDEMLFHTLIANSKFKSELKHRNLTYMKWITDGTPKVLDDDDHGDIIKAIHDGKIFARKFNPDVSHNIIDKIENNFISCNFPGK